MSERAPDCHPERKHYSRGFCGSCWRKMIRDDPDGFIAMGGKIRYAECHPDRPHQAFGLCTHCYDTQKYANRSRERRLVREYGLSLAEKQAMEDAQGGGCAICGRKPDLERPRTVRGTLHVDHDHNTGRVRGLLCNFCNVAIGMFDDNPETISIAAQYVFAGRTLVA